MNHSISSQVDQYTVELENFQGPLDLLLSLIERKELAVTDVAVGQVTADYLATVTALEAVHERELTWFLDVATRLVLHKSRALALENTSEEEVDAEDINDLTRQLQRYKRYRDSGQKLGRIYGPPMLTRGQRDSVLASLPPANVSLEALRSAWVQILNRQEMVAPVLRRRVVTITRADIQRTMHDLAARLSDRAVLAHVFDSKDRRFIVSAMIAILELVKSGLVSLEAEQGEWYAKTAT